MQMRQHKQGEHSPSMCSLYGADTPTQERAMQDTSPSVSGAGRADERAAQAEADMTEAGDVGEWLGTDSSRKILPNGTTSRLSRHSSSGHMDEVRTMLSNATCSEYTNSVEVTQLRQESPSSLKVS